MSRASGPSLAKIVGVGVTLAALAAAPPAGAALGGANPSQFTHNPNLRAVTVSDRPTGVVALYVFDRPLQAQAPAPASFTLGAYASDERVASTSASLVSGKPNVVEAVFPPSIDVNDVTNASVVAGSVASQDVIAKQNLSDSVAVTGSTSKAGTRGHTAGPDLVSAVVDDSNVNGNRMLYTFDQTASGAVAGSFGFVTDSGTVVTGDAVTKTSKMTVAVAFKASDGSVLDARRGFANLGAVEAPNGLASPEGTKPVPGTDGTTSRPDLLSAAASTSGGTTAVTFTYDEHLTAASAAAFHVYSAARSAFVPGSTAEINADGRSVVVQFPGTGQFNEHLVYAGTAAGAVSGTGGASAVDGAPIGGNAGAEATGFTTAPEALATTFDENTGLVTLVLDQRLAPTGGIRPADVRLLGADGLQTNGAAPSVITDGTDGAPAQAVVTLKFRPAEVKAAKSVQLDGFGGTGPGAYAFAGSNSPQDRLSAQNVVSILSPAATGMSIAPVGTPKSAFRLVSPRTTTMLPARVRAALRSTTSATRATANARVLAKFSVGRHGYRRIAVKKAATR